MSRSLFPLLAAAAVLGGSVALQPAAAQTAESRGVDGQAGQTTTTTTTITTTTKKLGDLTGRETVTEETSVTVEAPQASGSVSSAAAASGQGNVAPGGAPAATDSVMTKDGLRYACTGIAKDSREDPRWDAFAAKLVYTVQGGGYLPGVTTRIENQSGSEVFAVRCDAPWLLVDLPADSYTVIATAEDPQGQLHRRTADLSVGASGQSEAIIRFNEIPE